MQSPPLELVFDVAHFAGRNLLRAQGEADFDTISEIVRPWAERHPVLFTAACVGIPAWFWCHIERDRFRLVDRAVRLLDRLHA